MISDRDFICEDRAYSLFSSNAYSNYNESQQ